MIRNYFIVTLRNLKRSKFFSFINISGLAVSMTICIAVIMLVADQLSYDRHNTKRDRIFRVLSVPVNNSGVEQGGMDNATSPMALRDNLISNYTGIEKVVRLKRGFGNNWMEIDGADVNLPVKGFFADPEVLDFFELGLLYGDASKALINPYTVVLTYQAAKKLFKEDNPVGRTLKVDKDLYTITGVLKNASQKSHIVFEGLASMATVRSKQAEGKNNEVDDWLDFWGGWTYVLLNEDADKNQIAGFLDDLYTKHIATVTNPDQYKAKFKLQSLMDITPGRLLNNSIGPSMPWVIVYFLSGLAGIVMITSCFNFTNMSIARALTRAKEIGVRKVSGAARSQIFFQFLSESVIVSLFALVVAVLGIWVIKPFILQLNFARIFQWDLKANYFVYTIFFLFALTVGMVAGILPATVLSGFQPVKVLKKLSDVRLFSRIALRKSLIVVQFTLSLIFIISVIVLYNQLELFTGKDLGFNMENNLVVSLNGSSADQLKNELTKYSNVVSSAATSHVPAAGESRGNNFRKHPADKEWTSINYFATDAGYLQNLSIDLKAGRYFNSEQGDINKQYVVINEAAVKAFHFESPIDALGDELVYQQDSSRKTIIGVVKDYNHQILFSEIEPMALLFQPEEISFLHVRYSGDKESAMQSVSKAWTAVNPDRKLDCESLEGKVDRFYDTIFGDLVKVVGVIAGLAILISCMGLMGMATYATETKTKEISIRKVLGSSDTQLVILLSNSFIKLLVIAVMIGIPLSWMLNDLWLSLIAYRTSLSVSVFSIGVLTLLILGTITIGSQTLRAALTNPVNNLRSE